jgi:hypothetical protein
MNYIEMMPILIVPTAIAGIYFPIVACVTAWSIFVGRIIYSIGYLKNPNARIYGFIIIALSNMTNFVLAFTSAFMWMSQVKK